MSERRVKRRRLTKFAVGDMRERISLEERSIAPPTFGSQAFTEEYTALDTVWASVETKDFANSGQRFFNAVNDPALTPSHVFTIRWRDDITTETRVRWQDELYKLLLLTDPQERHQYLVLNAKLLGSDEKEVNQ